MFLSQIVNLDFDIVIVEERTFFVVIGTDLRKKDDESKAEAKIIKNNKDNKDNEDNKQLNKVKVIHTPDSIPSIKIFDLNKLQIDIEEKNEIIEENKKDKEKANEFGVLMPNSTIFLMYKKENLNDFYKGDNLLTLNDAYVPISNIACFGVSQKLNSVAFSFQDCLIEIKLELSQKEKPIQPLYPPIIHQDKDKKNMTNIKYILSGLESYLYFTSSNTTYYKRTGDTNVNHVGEENILSGAGPQNFDVNSEKKILLSTFGDCYLEEYSLIENRYEKLIMRVYERQTRFTQFHKNYFVFVLYEEEKPSLCVYDPLNNIFLTLDENFKSQDILSVVSSNDRIYVLAGSSDSKKITCLKECDNKEKFDSFYKRQFFEVAYTYGKNLGYDKKKLSEISKLHAEYLYKKSDFEKSIEQYKLTINYLDPSYVIQKFLDGSKLNYLIDYLEALQNNDEFKKNCNDERLKDFTALLLNCYIKQKQIKKLKDFVERKNIKDEVTIKTAIEVCKDTNKIDLALSIAQKEKMLDSFIQILMDIKGDFKESLEYIGKITDIKKKFDLLLAYGEKFLEKKDVIDEAMKVISKLIDEIINIKNNNPNDEKLKKSN